jgi:thiopeptide-type bacteriocin biosynthesis protein
MSPDSCLYTIAYAPRERIETLLLDHFAPIALELRDHPDLHSLFFVRYSEPRWQLRFRVLGAPAWVQGPVRHRLAALVDRLETDAEIEGHEFHRYDREIERYGGEEGMELAERLFAADSLAAIEFCQADRAGVLRRNRREVALLVADRLADLIGLDRRQRIAYYRHGYAWAREIGAWGDEDEALLETRFQNLLPGLDRLFDPALSQDTRWGGPVGADIAARFLARAAPILRSIREGHDAGRISQDLIYLAWSYAHMFTNRMGVESTPEAILRWFMHRYLKERRPIAV